jgi:hypothetical protein
VDVALTRAIYVLEVSSWNPGWVADYTLCEFPNETHYLRWIVGAVSS